MAKCIRIPVTGPAAPHDATSLDEFQAGVGGNIEVVGLRDGNALYMNEDGKRLALPTNWRATILAEKFGNGLFPGDTIRGDCILAGPPDDDGDETDLAPDFLAGVVEYLNQ